MPCGRVALEAMRPPPEKNAAKQGVHETHVHSKRGKGNARTFPLAPPKAHTEGFVDSHHNQDPRKYYKPVQRTVVIGFASVDEEND